MFDDRIVNIVSAPGNARVGLLTELFVRLLATLNNVVREHPRVHAEDYLDVALVGNTHGVGEGFRVFGKALLHLLLRRKGKIFRPLFTSINHATILDFNHGLTRHGVVVLHVVDILCSHERHTGFVSEVNYFLL